MRSVLFATAAAVFVLVFAQRAGADDLETLQAIPIAALSLSVDESDSHFMIVYERMGETATAAVFAGIIGAGINSAINADQDAALARPYLAAANALPLRDIIENSIRSTLEAKGMGLTDAAEASHLLRVEIKDWGLDHIPETSSHHEGWEGTGLGHLPERGGEAGREH